MLQETLSQNIFLFGWQKETYCAQPQTAIFKMLNAQVLCTNLILEEFELRDFVVYCSKNKE